MRLIDADALLEIIRTLCRDLWEDVWNFFDGKPHRSRDYLRGLENGYWEIKKDIEQLPTIDAVKVVRCQNCKHGYFAGTALYCSKQSRSHAWHKAAINWFCADGERREDDGTRDI